MKLQVVLPGSIELKKREYFTQLSSLCSNLQSIHQIPLINCYFRKYFMTFQLSTFIFFIFSLLQTDFSNELSRSAIFRIIINFKHFSQLLVYPFSLSDQILFFIFKRSSVSFSNFFFPHVSNKVNFTLYQEQPMFTITNPRHFIRSPFLDKDTSDFLLCSKK